MSKYLRQLVTTLRDVAELGLPEYKLEREALAELLETAARTEARVEDLCRRFEVYQRYDLTRKAGQ